jgi:hypothetical protein
MSVSSRVSISEFLIRLDLRHHHRIADNSRESGMGAATSSMESWRNVEILEKGCHPVLNRARRGLSGSIRPKEGRCRRF